METRDNKIGLISLGCPKALVDSERILTRLKSEGYSISSSYEEADAVIVNTCGFLDEARQEGVETILEIEEMKNNGKIEASKIPQVWNAWLHHMTDELPETSIRKFSWIKEHVPNLTGTPYAYEYKDKKDKKKIKNIYSTWSPNE